MDKKAVMKKIVEKVGRERAIDLVASAYNTELLTTNLLRLEAKDRKIGGYQARDLLADALQRVDEVCDLAS
jgi:hypothetical protein